jgi:hypothetical protein
MAVAAAALVATKKTASALTIGEYEDTLPTEDVIKVGTLGRQATSISGITFPSRKVRAPTPIPLACELAIDTDNTHRGRPC